MTVIEERLSVLDSLVLKHGSHPDWEHGACVMEAVSYVAGEPWSDAPACASPVITSFLVSWNDSLSDEDRQMLKPLIPLVVGTRTTKRDEEMRAWMCTDWLARECAPAFLRLAGLTEHAERLESLAPLTSAAKARKAQPSLDAARKDAAAARDAAWTAAWTAARDAARAAAWTAARDAVWTAARAAARDAAWTAARAAAGAAARDAAWTAARAAAWDAAWDAAWAAARDAAKDVAEQGGGYSAQYDAAYKAAQEVFEKQPPEGLISVTTGLQASAYQLVERMCEVGR